MELTGTVKSGMLPGLVSSINRFDIKALNNDESLGVWGVSKSPKITIKRYEEGSLKEGRENEYTRTVYLHPILDKKSVIINPSLDIKDYKVSVRRFCQIEYALQDLLSKIKRQLKQHKTTHCLTLPNEYQT